MNDTASTLRRQQVTARRRVPREFSIQRAIYQFDLTPQTFSAYAALCAHADPVTSSVEMSYNKLARLTRMSRSTAIASIDELLSAHLIERERVKTDDGANAANVYYVCEIESEE